MAKWMQIIITCILCSCAGSRTLYSPNNGEYLNEEDKREKLIITDSSFVHFLEKPKHEILPSLNYDTLSFGTWGVVDGGKFLYLSSTPDYLLSTLPVEVKESEIIGSDTLEITISCPIRNADNLNAVTFDAAINAENGVLEEVFGRNETDPVIKFLNPRHLQIKSIIIGVYPGPGFIKEQRGTTAVRCFYSLNKKSSNKFAVNIPGLTYKYFSIDRLNRDFVRIIDKDRLEWNGKLFNKK